ncbi:MAG: hypothetical protein IKI15_10150, partial [Lachnospiraceae bacterium]|nr:hypothetical protein [Lachnospiraceae bacterium]
HTDVHPGVEIPQPEAQRALIAGGYSILTYGHVFLMESGLTSFTNIHFTFCCGKFNNLIAQKTGEDPVPAIPTGLFLLCSFVLSALLCYAVSYRPACTRHISA